MVESLASQLPTRVQDHPREGSPVLSSPLWLPALLHPPSFLPSSFDILALLHLRLAKRHEHVDIPSRSPASALRFAYPGTLESFRLFQSYAHAMRICAFRPTGVDVANAYVVLEEARFASLGHLDDSESR